MKSIRSLSSALVLCALSIAFNASAAEKPTSATSPSKPDSSQIQKPGDTVLQVSGGLAMYPIGDSFFALLPKIPLQLESPQDFLKNHITGITWQVSDSRGLDEDHKFGLSLKAPAGSSLETPTFVHVSGLTKAFKLTDTAQFQLTEKGLVVIVGKNKEAYLVLKMKDMKITMTSSPSAGLATTTKASQ